MKVIMEENIVSKFSGQEAKERRTIMRMSRTPEPKDRKTRKYRGPRTPGVAKRKRRNL